RTGRGYSLGEDGPIADDGRGKFDPAEGVKAAAGGKPTYSQSFGEWRCDMAAPDPRLVAITPAMREGSGMVKYSEQFPSRYFDVGIAEQHAVTFAAGLACEGMRPVLGIYSTFLQRGYDQLIHDVAIQNLPVLFALDRAGLVGGDGATHNGAFDFAYLRTVPNLTVMAPADADECRQMLYTGFMSNGPCSVRYPRGAALGGATNGSCKEGGARGTGHHGAAGHDSASGAAGPVHRPWRPGKAACLGRAGCARHPELGAQGNVRVI